MEVPGCWRFRDNTTIEKYFVCVEDPRAKDFLRNHMHHQFETDFVWKSQWLSSLEIADNSRNIFLAVKGGL